MEKKENCPCAKADCPRRGDCGACRAHHAAEGKRKPYCEKGGRKRKKRVKERKG